jgi:secondary thiamine-phosphate synthase enzyme
MTTNRSSISTVRSLPAADQTTAVGFMRVHVETFTIETTARLQIVDLTERVSAIVRAFPLREGMGTLASMHTTCAVCLNEFQDALAADYEVFLKSLVDPGHPWRHNDPAQSDCDRANTGAHLQALLLGHNAAFQVSRGELALGRWQRILAVELDGPQTRTLRLSVMGVS